MSVTAQAVEEALQECIVKGVYPPGSKLPSVRSLASQFGTSPSTVSRALQGLERRSWVRIEHRRGAFVSLAIPRNASADERMAEELRTLVARWRLHGRTAEDFMALVHQVVETAFRPPPRAFFVECNPVEVTKIRDQIAREIGVELEPLLLAGLEADPSIVDASLVVTSFFHLAEVRSLTGPDASIIPLNLVPSEDTMRTLSEFPRDALLVAIGRDHRKTQQIVGLASHYAVTRVVGVTLRDRERMEQLVEEADAVVVTNATGLPDDIRSRARRVIVVAFDVEPSGLDAVRAAIRSAETRQVHPGPQLAAHGASS